MAKRKDDTEERQAAEELVRYVAKMTREERARLRYFCEMRKLDMERIGAQWILERLAQEESTDSRPPRRR